MLFSGCGRLKGPVSAHVQQAYHMNCPTSGDVLTAALSLIAVRLRLVDIMYC